MRRPKPPIKRGSAPEEEEEEEEEEKEEEKEEEEEEEEGGPPIYIYIHRLSQEECARIREGVPYVKVYRYNPKHLRPKLNGYGDNGQRKVRASCGSKYCNLHS